MRNPVVGGGQCFTVLNSCLCPDEKSRGGWGRGTGSYSTHTVPPIKIRKYDME
jgi:hypothetical protein